MEPVTLPKKLKHPYVRAKHAEAAATALLGKEPSIPVSLQDICTRIGVALEESADAYRGALCTRPDGVVTLVTGQGLTPPERRHALAHLLGHHVMHSLTEHEDQRGAPRNVQCHEAEVFADTLLVPSAALRRAASPIPQVLAFLFGVPCDVVARRLAIINGGQRR